MGEILYVEAIIVKSLVLTSMKKMTVVRSLVEVLQNKAGVIGQNGASVLKTVVLGDGQETDTAQALSAGTPPSHRRGSATHSLALRSSGTNQESMAGGCD